MHTCAHMHVVMCTRIHGHVYVCCIYILYYIILYIYTHLVRDTYPKFQWVTDDHSWTSKDKHQNGMPQKAVPNSNVSGRIGCTVLTLWK